MSDKLPNYRSRYLNDLATVLGSSAGRTVILEFLTRCKHNQSIYSSDQSAMCFNSGKQDVGFELMSDLLTLNVDFYTAMIKEYNDYVKDLENV